jgi:hypothetical protein
MSDETSSQIFEYESIARALFGPYACRQTGAETRNLAPEEMAVRGIHAVRQLIDDISGPARITDIGEASRDDIPEMVQLYRTNSNITEFFEEWCKRETPTASEATALFEKMFEPEFRLP